MYCRKCGARMSEQDRFCPECGTEASKGNTQQDELNGFPGNEQPQENPRMNKKTVIWIWILAAWILLIAIGISAFFIVKGQHVKKQYQSSLEAGDKYLENLDYADDWTWNDVWYAFLLGGMSGTFVGLLCYYLMSVRMRPGREIMTAIKREQFYVVYQPVVDTQALRVTGLEVLLRWRHPVAGEIPPDAFINFAEAQKMIVPLTQHLFELIARDAAELEKVLPVGVKFGINIAPAHLHSESFKADIQKLLTSLPAHHFQIVLEITERDMLKEREATQLFAWLHSVGVEIAIDDFGTGHSALIYLERFTLDYLKIDRGFINAIGTETITSPVLDAVLTLAKRLNMLTVAEGVETPEQARWLSERGVNFMQGYWISRPLPLDDFVRWLKKPYTPQW